MILFALVLAVIQHEHDVVSAMKPPHKNVIKQHQTDPSPLFRSLARSKATSSSRRVSDGTQQQNVQPLKRVFHRKNAAINPPPIDESPSYFGFSPIVTPQCAAVSMASRLISERRRQQGQGQGQGRGPASRTTTTTAAALRGGSSTVLLASTTILPIAPSSWLLPAVSCATSYALYNLFIKKASDSMDPILGGVLLQFVAALIGSLLWLGQRLVVSGKSATLITKSGILWSVAAGVAVGAAEILSFVVSGKGVPATQSIPIIVGGSILVGTLLGSVWLQERLSRTGWMGVLLIAAGIALVGMDGVGGH